MRAARVFGSDNSTMVCTGGEPQHQWNPQVFPVSLSTFFLLLDWLGELRPQVKKHHLRETLKQDVKLHRLTK